MMILGGRSTCFRFVASGSDTFGGEWEALVVTVGKWRRYLERSETRKGGGGLCNGREEGTVEALFATVRKRAGAHVGQVTICSRSSRS